MDQPRSIEAVSPSYWPTYFAKLRASLADGEMGAIPSHRRASLAPQRLTIAANRKRKQRANGRKSFHLWPTYNSKSATKITLG